MRIVSGEKCSDLVLLCPNHRRTLRLYRDAKSLLADEAGSTHGVNAVEVSKWIANCMGSVLDRRGSGRTVARRLIRPCALAILLVANGAVAQSDKPLTLNPDVPLTYTVQPGDTLWDIAALFLRDPWRWEALWAGNPQVGNPHLIYPGDTLSLVWESGQPRLVRAEQGDIKLSPSMRASPLDLAIPAISRQHIEPFLRQHQVVEAATLDRTPYVVSGDAGRLISGVGDTLYGKGKWGDALSYRLVRRVEKLKDPVSGEGLGIFVSDIGEARLQEGPTESENVAAMTVSEMREEVRIGDRLLPVTEAEVEPFYQPQAPSEMISDAYMIGVAGGVTQISVLDIVVINRGARESLQVGDVLAIDHAGELVKDPVTGKPVRLPDTRAGVLMVFSVYDRASFGLVLEASKPLSVGDKLSNP